MSFRLRFTCAANEDLQRLYEFLAQRDGDSAERAMKAIAKAWLVLEDFPFTCKKATGANSPFLRELHIPFGHAGYVALFEVEDRDTVTVLAIRHQREDDYH